MTRSRDKGLRRRKIPGAGVRQLLLSDFGTLALLLNADDVTTQDDSGTLKTIAVNDQSGNGVVYDQPVTTAPVYDGALINGRQAIGDWTASADYLDQSAGSSIATTTFTLYIVVDFDDVATDQFVLDHQTGRALFRIESGKLAYNDNVGLHNSGVTPATGPSIWVWQINGASSFCRANGTQGALTGVTGAAWGNVGAIGRRYDGASIQPVIDGIYGEIVGYSPAVTNVAGPEGVLKAKWGISF